MTSMNKKAQQIRATVDSLFAINFYAPYRFTHKHMDRNQLLVSSWKTVGVQLKKSMEHHAKEIEAKANT